MPAASRVKMTMTIMPRLAYRRSDRFWTKHKRGIVGQRNLSRRVSAFDAWEFHVEALPPFASSTQRTVLTLHRRSIATGLESSTSAPDRDTVLGPDPTGRFDSLVPEARPPAVPAEFALILVVHVCGRDTCVSISAVTSAGLTASALMIPPARAPQSIAMAAAVSSGRSST